MIAGWLWVMHPDLIVERNNHHAIIGAKLIHERDRRVLNLLKLEPRRSTRVDHQRHGERFFS